MHSAQLVLIRSRNSVISHSHQRHVLGPLSRDELRGRLCGHERSGIEPFGLRRRDDPLRAGAGALNDRQAVDVGLRGFERRVAQVESARRAAANLSDHELTGACAAKRQRLIDPTDHDDLCRTACQEHGSGSEGTEYIDDDYRADRAFSARE